ARYKEKRVLGSSSSFRDAWEEEEKPTPQIQVKDPSLPRPPAEATQGT
uniref:Uncharacterized protein n=1 Tax=Jaculus jaculus TaxID=51337 RepID=A0A8C5NUU2_JACJA